MTVELAPSGNMNRTVHHAVSLLLLPRPHVKLSDLYTIVRQLQAEKELLDRAIVALEPLETRGPDSLHRGASRNEGERQQARHGHRSEFRHGRLGTDH